MCGIAGIVCADPRRPVDAAMLERMREILHHRGPDDAGLHVDGGVGLASRRLAILDLSSRGRMPMATPDGRYSIVYNGEIYNYRALRAGLEARGCRFHSETDTEVLLSLYALEGPAALERLNGMFAFAVWDAEERSLFLARDRLGIKPLYYAWHDGALYFASEAKALWAAGVPARFDHSLWEELLCFRFVAGERTPYVGIWRVLPGHYLRFHDGQLRTMRWWSLGERGQARRSALPEDLGQQFREALDKAVDLHRISDVPVGILLSGGLDSGSIAAALGAQAGSGVASFTVRFAEREYDEGPVAAKVAARWGLEPHDLFVRPEQLPTLLSRAAWLNDEPLAHSSDVFVHAIASVAKPLVTVLLSGEGADETMGGYVRYRPLLHPALVAAGRRWLPTLIGATRAAGRSRRLARLLALPSTDRLILYNACEVLPDELVPLGILPSWESPYRHAVLQEAKRFYREPVRQAMYLDQHTFLCSVLDRNDRMTMGASIECRVPYLDYHLVETAAALPTRVLLNLRHGKLPLRHWVGDRLPAEVLRQRKWGFGVPWRGHVRQVPELVDRFHALVRSPLLKDSPLDPEAVRTLGERFWRGDDDAFPLLFQLFVVDLAWEAARAGTRARGIP